MKCTSFESVFPEISATNYSARTFLVRRVLKKWACAAVAAIVVCAAGAHAQSAFAALPVGTTSATQSVTVTDTTPGTVSSVEVFTMGASGADFAQVTGSATCMSVNLGAPGDTCTQSVSFTPSAPGLRMGAVVLLGSGGVLGETLIYGTGTGGLAVLVPGNTLPFAGDGNYIGPVLDGNPALNSELYSPTAVAKDGAGNVYIADRDHNRIRMVSAASGQISTVAGTGTAGYTGDSGLATAATLSTPSGIAIDGAGDIYIADTGNNVIRKIDAISHDITTFAGNVTDHVPGYAGDGTPADSAGVLLNAPQGVTVDYAGDLFIADTNNQVIREVVASTKDISTVAGDYYGPFGNGVGGYNGDGIQATSATLYQPYAVALDATGDLLIADTANNRIRLVNASSHLISTVVGDGTAGATGDNGAATSAELNAPTGIALDPAGNLYIGDTQNYRIRKVSAQSQTITTLAVSGSEYLALPDILNSVVLKGPQGVFVDSQGNVYFANTLSMQVWEIESNLAALDFTATPIRQGNISLPLYQTIENDGNDTTIPMAFTSFTASTNAQLDPTAGAGSCATTQPLAVDTQCTVGVIFSPAITPVLTVNTTEAGTVSAAYSTAASINGPNSPLDIVAVGIAEPLNSTTTTVSATPNPSLFGQTVNFTIQVTTGTGTGALTGTVSLVDTFGGNTVTLAPNLALNASGQATFSITTLAVGVHSIKASYSGDSSHTSSTSTDNGVAPWSQVVEEQTAILLTSSANPSLVGQSVTFTATVTAPDGGGVAPDGTVSFLDGNNTLFTGQLVGGVLTYTTSTLTNGLHPITAVYSGDVNKEILGETSTVLDQDVQAQASMTLASSANPSFFGNPVTFTATISSTATVPAGGVVTFYDANAKIGTGTLNAANPDVAQFTTSTLAVGTHSITASYSGDNYNTVAAALPLSQVISQTVTATTVNALPNPGIAGAAEAITATVRITQGAGTPTGLVTFTSGTTVLGTANLTAAGIATINPVLTPGNYTIVATYAGDTNDAGSQSAPFALTVAQAQTTTVVVAVPNPTTYLQNVSFAATVTGNGAVPTGTVEFYANGALIGAGALNSGGVATLVYANLPIGTATITATYEGDTNDAGSTSAPVTLVVGKIPTTTALGSSTTSGANPQLNLVATVAGNVGPVPTGTVTFMNANATLGTATLDATGLAALDVNLPAGTYVIQAIYSGDATHAPSTSLPITVTSNPVAFNLSVTPNAMTVKTTQYAQVGVILTSVGGFTDTLGMGCASLPPGVTCHFSTPTVNLAADGSATEQLTIDTDSPLTGGSMAANHRSNGTGLYMAGLLLPFSVFFGFLFGRSRRRMGSAFSLALIIVLSTAALFVSGCSGISTSSAAAGSYTIQVVASGQNTGVVESQTVTLTVTQ
jgi:large repetitive protein